LQIRGTIYHHARLTYHDGIVGKKYLVLLNTPGNNEPYLFVKATSQEKTRPKTPGCIKGFSLFFVPAGKAFFPLNTWIQLYDIYEIDPNKVDQKVGMTIEGTLSTKMIDDVVNCLFECESANIPQNRKDLLRPPMIDALQKLKARFDSCR